MELDDVIRKMRRAADRERQAMTRLRRAQTLYDKAHDSHVRIETKYFEILDTVAHVTARLTKGN